MSAYLPDPHLGVCPVCSGPAAQDARYPRALCEACTQAAVCEPHGLPALIGSAELQLSGLEAGHLKAGRWELCTEDVLVHGVPCTLREAYMGGAVIQPRAGSG